MLQYLDIDEHEISSARQIAKRASYKLQEARSSAPSGSENELQNHLANNFFVPKWIHLNHGSAMHYQTIITVNL